ncbi:50S ribosomal protein L19, chloroplastic [Mercurialis annua]|uniref:50S ribosomal protein L19, chloroplastic n=1 Tax=Mercurialis annua TaxID=3986 RepID=UPI00215FAEE6|nr:50S ribosomal protein L19, chloroplastic [Mercurialis annua]
MGSKILPQALVAIPRNPNQCQPPPRKLGFSTSIHRCSSTSRVSISSRASFGSNLDSITSAFAKQRFIARAESEEAAAAVEVVEESEVEVEEDEVKVEETPKEPRKPIIKLGDIMGILNKRAVEASEKERPIPEIRTGDVVVIKLEVPENRRRQSIYKGIVISRQNAGIHTTIRIRRIIAGVGVEIVFPLYSPNVKEIRVVSHRKVRRARLYYLRDKLPRLSTFK